MSAALRETPVPAPALAHADMWYAVTGPGPDYIIPGPWPELTPSALWFRQEPPFITVNSGVRPS